MPSPDEMQGLIDHGKSFQTQIVDFQETGSFNPVLVELGNDLLFIDTVCALDSDLNGLVEIDLVGILSYLSLDLV